MKTFPSSLIIALAVLSFFSCQKEEYDFELTGTEWKVEKIKEDGDSFFRRTFKKYVFEFQSDSTFGFNLDVNDCSGYYQKAGMEGKIFFEPPSCTKKCCDSEFAEDLVRLIPQMTTYYRKGNRLFLEGRGEIVLTRR